MNMISAEELYENLKKREANIWADLEDNEVLVMEYHAPTGERMRIDQVGYYADSEAMILVGHDVMGNECQLIASPMTLHVVFRVVNLEEPRQRNRVGFTSPHDE
jgi:hypothetical protein